MRHLTIKLDDSDYENFGIAAKALRSDKSKLIRDYVKGVCEADRVRREIVMRNTAAVEDMSAEEIMEAFDEGILEAV